MGNALMAMVFAGSITIPEVVNHPEYLSRADMVSICQERAEVAQQPCAVVEVDDRVCFAFMNMEGQSSTVHCFNHKEDDGDDNGNKSRGKTGLTAPSSQAMVNDGPAGWIPAGNGGVSGLPLWSF